jgi:HEAT repeat protein
LTPTPEAALRDIHASRAEFRIAAARALGDVAPELAAAAIDGLRTLCQDADARVRLDALSSLARLGDASVLDAVLAQRGDVAPAVRASALLAAEALGCDDAVLVDSAKAADPALQRAALEALVARASASSGGHDHLEAAAAGALADASPEVRATAAAALAAMDARVHLSALAERLDDRPLVRSSVALALADMGDARGVPALLEDLAAGSFAAAEALGALGVEAAREPLAASAGRFFTPLLTKAAAGAALIRLGDPRGEDALRAVLRAFRPDGRPYAVVQVMQLRVAALQPELEALVRRPRGVDRGLLREALAALSASSAGGAA